MRDLSSTIGAEGPEPMEQWPFDQPPNCAAITLRSIVFGGAPILRVTHDLDDHGWQFLGIEDATDEDAAVVSMARIAELDPTVFEVANLPPGWHAWRRTIHDPWVRERNLRMGMK
jgi:hypothetical protein